MKANYSACLKIILKNEGGYVNNPKDPGGETNYGITKSTAKANGYTGSMRSIPMSVVEAIYRTKFWVTSKFSGDSLADGVDLAWFDYGVNSGPARANTALNSVIGGDPVDTIKKLCASRTTFLKHLKTWVTFGKGWGRRVAEVEATAVKMALAAKGKPSEEVAKDLKVEQKQAESARNAAVTKAASAPVAGGAGTQAVPAADHAVTTTNTAPHDTVVTHATSFDWHTLLYVGIGVVVVAVIAIMIVGAINNHKRAAAYAEAAKAA
jgi:lysozyme family protein